MKWREPRLANALWACLAPVGWIVGGVLKAHEALQRWRKANAFDRAMAAALREADRKRRAREREGAQRRWRP